MDRILFCVLLIVLCTRPLLGETFEYLQVSFVTALQAGPGATPATTAVLDSVLLAAAALTLARRGRWRKSRWIAVGAVLLAVAVGLSTSVAGDQHSALLAGSNLVITALAGAALVCLVRTRWMMNLLLAGLLATGATTAVKCLSQRWYENPLTEQRWEAVYKPALIRQGFDPQDPLFVNFERRMHAGEAYGFLNHPNVTATALLMWLLVAAGLLATAVAEVVRARRRSGAPRAGPLVIAAGACLLLGAALPPTGSRGALLSAAFGAVLLVVFGLAAAGIARHARAALAVLAAGYLAIIAAGLAYGLRNDTLPGSSLAFRWQYWTAAWRAWQDVPLTGLGRENFGPAYLQYKRAASPEEVRDPHNLWVSLLVELGPLGLIAGALFCGASVLAGLRRPLPLTERAGGQSPPGALGLSPTLGLAAGVLVVHALLSGTQFAEPGVWLVWGQEIALPLVLSLLLCVPLLNGLEWDGLGVRWLGAGLCAALCAVLLHSLIDFTLLTPAGAGLFALCAVGAATVGRQCPEDPREFIRPYGRTRPVAIAAGVVAFYVVCVARPTVLESRTLSDLEAATRAGPARGGSAAVLRLVHEAMTTSADPVVLRASARAMVRVSSWPDLGATKPIELLAQAEECASRACVYDRRDSANYALAGNIAGELAIRQQALGQVDDAAQSQRRAAEDWQRAVELYPTGTDQRLAAGAAWMAVWKSTGDADAARRASDHFREALAIDDARPAKEVVRLRPSQRQQVLDALAALAPSTASSRSQGGGS